MVLVLNPKMGHLSPQFHVKSDDLFETVNKQSQTQGDPRIEIPKQVYIKAVQASQKEAQYAAIVMSRAT